MGVQTVTPAIFPVGGMPGVDFTKVATVPEFKLGTELDASDGNRYRYIQASGALTAFDAARLLETGEAEALTTTNAGAVPADLCFPQIAFADNEYGWAVVRGQDFDVRALASCAADVKLYTTATAGAIDDSSSGTVLIAGLRLNATNGGSTAAVSASAVNGARIN